MKYKKFWAFLLCLSMLVSMFAVSAIAEENETGSEFAAADMEEAVQPEISGTGNDADHHGTSPAEGDETVPPKTSDKENETDHHATSPAEGDETVPPKTSDTENETDYNAMSPADLYAVLKAMDGGKAKEVYQTLTDDTRDALYEYEDSLETDEPTLPGGPAENFTNVAPLVEAGSENLPARSAMPKKAPLRSTVRMVAASASEPPSQPEPTTTDGLVTSKTVTPNNNGGYDITLEAYLTGSVQTIINTVPADIVLVLDVSGSMIGDYTTTYTYTPVLGGIYSTPHSTYFGFINYRSEYYIKLSDGTYQEVKYTYFDSNHFDYYRYNNGDQYVYLYPQLAEGTTNVTRIEDYDVEQFYVRTESTNSKLDALKEAVNAFITSTEEQNKVLPDAKKNRISIVKFAGNQNQAIGNDMYNHDYYNYTQIVNDLTSDMEGLHNAVGGLTYGGATSIDYGLEFANNVLTGTGNTQLRGAREDANKVVIVFTDGEPNHDNGFDVNVANSALAAANSLKTAKATVYTICIAGGAQVNAGEALPGSNTSINRFMHLLSSNYPNSTSMDTVGENGSTGVMQTDGTYKSYYLTPADGAGLTDVFERISEQIGTPTTSLGTSTVIKDVVSQYFKLPTDTSAVTVKSVACTSYNNGVAEWEDTGTVLSNAVTLDAENNTVNVSGFGFDKNFVSANGYQVGNPQGAGSYHGSKLVITFSIGVKDGFLGGNNVPTNGEASGVYSDSGAVTPLNTFIVPTVNVPINLGGVSFGGTEQIIYYGGAVNPLYTGIDQTQAPWRFDYVNIDYSTPDNVSNSKCGEYTVSATIAPKYDGSPPLNSSVSGAKAESRTLTGTSQVHVLVPTATWNDKTIYLGSTAQYDDPAISWIDEGHHDLSNISVSGNAPVTAYEYSQIAAAFKSCTMVTPTIKLEGTGFVMPAFTVHVLKPEITWQDSTCYFGAAFPNSFAPVKIDWKDSSNDGGTTNLPAPALTYTFTNDITENADLMPNRDVNIRVSSVKIGSSPTDYRGDVTFSWQSNAACPSCDDPNPEHQFRIHPLTCTLTIKKSCEHVASNDSFIFTVKGSDNEFASKVNGMKVVVMGAGSATVTGLPIGSYTVTENTDWSWRYTPAGSGSVTLSEDTPDANVIIENTLSNNQWLSGSCYAVNRWKENSIVVKRSAESIVTQLVDAVKNVF